MNDAADRPLDEARTKKRRMENKCACACTAMRHLTRAHVRQPIGQRALYLGLPSVTLKSLGKEPLSLVEQNIRKHKL